MKLTDDLLRKAAGLAQQQELEEHFSPSDQPLPISDTLLAWMQQLAEQLEQGKLTGAKALPGWHYYVRNTAAAVLIGFLCLAAAAPDAVLAGCQKLIETIETVFEEYTEYRYQSHVPAGTELVPLHPGYLPEGMEEQIERREEDQFGIWYEFENTKEGQILVMRQELLPEGTASTHITDSEDAEIELQIINGWEVKLFSKNNQIHFIWNPAVYKITGVTNLPKNEVVEIIENMEFDW